MCTSYFDNSEPCREGDVRRRAGLERQRVHDAQGQLRREPRPLGLAEERREPGGDEDVNVVPVPRVAAAHDEP